MPWLRRGRALGALLLAWCLVPPAWAQADEARARKIVMGNCFICHGAQGESASELFPRLAGQHAAYVAKQLDHFKTGKRSSSAMAPMVAKLSADEMLALGHYFEKQTVTAEPPQDAGLAALGRDLYLQGNPSGAVAACASCHGAQALGTASLPRLAGQLAAYTETQLKQFSQRPPTPDNAAMRAVASQLTHREMAAVAQYLSGL